MTIWIDAQLSPTLAPWITERFRIETRAVRDLGLRDAKDRVIYQAAREAGVIVITIDAREALRIGLVNRVVPADELQPAVHALASRIAGHFPLELALTRNAVYRALDVDFDAAVEEETGAALLSYMGGARQTGMAEAMERIRQDKPGA